MTKDPYRPVPPPAPPGAGAPDLQFDRAEPAAPASPASIAGFGPPPTAPATACAACGRPITDYYFEASGKLVCPQCQQLILQSHDAGSGAAPFFKAVLFGIGAAVAGAGIWFGIALIPGSRLYNLGAVFLGLLVGGAVRSGSGGRGGIPYQLVAVFVTYLTVGITYTVHGLWTEGHFSDMSPLRIGFILVYGGFVFPVLAAMSNVFFVFILGFAIYEAWKMNRRQKIVFNGPYRVAPVAPPAATPIYAVPAPPSAWPPPAGGA